MTKTPTVADLLKRLCVPASRVRLDPPPGRATEADVLRLLDRHNIICELVDGVLVEKPMGFEESVVTCELTYVLMGFLRDHNLGILSGPDGTMKLTTGLLRIPDIAFFAWDSLPGRKRPNEPVPRLPLDLAIEVLSRGNTRAEMKRKVREYFDAGTRLVWLIDPRDRSARVFTAPGAMTALAELDRLDGGDVLPGFSLRLKDLFDAASRGPGA